MQIQIIKQQEVLGKDFKIYGTPDEPLFLAKDVAVWIDYSESNTAKLVSMVDSSEKVRKIVTTLGGNQEAWFLTEDGLYEILMQSRKPLAKRFKSEVKRILKDIRKTGGYVANEDTFVNTYLPFADDTTKALFRTTLETIRQQNAKIEADKPKVLFADSVTTAKTSILVGDLAKLIRQNGYEIGQKRLFKWLRENGYLMKTGESYNMPTQYSMERGLMEVKVTTLNQADGSSRITRTTKITGAGQLYFVNKFLGKGDKH